MWADVLTNDKEAAQFSSYHLSPGVVRLHTRGRLVPELVHPEDDGWNNWEAHALSCLIALYLDIRIGRVLVDRHYHWLGSHLPVREGDRILCTLNGGSCLTISPPSIGQEGSYANMPPSCLH